MFRLLTLAATLLAIPAHAANDGRDVVVVFNSAMPESKDVAEHYANVREVPATQVVGFELPKREGVNRSEFRKLLEQPLLQFLEKQKLFTFRDKKVVDTKIRYLVLCYGVPLAIAQDSSIEEKIDFKSPPEVRKNGAAVDSELALLPAFYEKLLLTGPLTNPLFLQTNSVVFSPTNKVLMVARLDGPSAEIARGLVDKAMQAERDGLWGYAYFDLGGITNANYKQVNTNLSIAAASARELGFEVMADSRPETFPTSFPMSQIALYAGWYAQDVCGPFARRKVEFMPGAFAYHLHSYSAQTLRSTNSHWCGPLLAKGVTATMGAVDEPYIDGLPDMGVFFTRWLLLGMTYGESAYASLQTLSWQTTVIGDPLYRPFGKSPQAQHEDLVKRGSKLVEWSHLKVVNLNLNLGTSAAELVKYLEDEPTTRTSAVLSEKLGDLLQTLKKPDLSIAAYRQALKAGPSPIQEENLRIGLIDKLAATGKIKEALAELEEFRKHCPDYPDMTMIERGTKELQGRLH